MDNCVGGDFKTPNLGFCSGSKGTLDDPSGLTSRLRSVFLNSAPWHKKKIQAAVTKVVTTTVKTFN